MFRFRCDHCDYDGWSDELIVKYDMVGKFYECPYCGAPDEEIVDITEETYGKKEI